MRIILASKSPRRRELLSSMFSRFEIICEQTDESYSPEIHPRDAVELLAVRKGEAVALSQKLEKVGEIVQNNDETTRKVGDEYLKSLKNNIKSEDTMIISSDTLVELDGAPLGKPASEEDAVRMLTSLSGKGHNVHTGVSVIFGGKTYSGVASSRVIFKSFDEACAREYVATGEPMDKAGSYAIQGIGGALVERYEGDFDTIVGLSMSLTDTLIRRALGIEE